MDGLKHRRPESRFAIIDANHYAQFPPTVGFQGRPGIANMTRVKRSYRAIEGGRDPSFSSFP